MRICIDPGHGMSNKKRLVYDPGAVYDKYTEAAIVMTWANTLKKILEGMGHTVIRTRTDAKDPCPIGRRDDIARAYNCSRMISLHCNAANGRATGTEVFYRGADDKALAAALSRTVSSSLGLADRGPKTEADSQHPSLAVMEFDKCWLVELGFMDNPHDLARILDPYRMGLTCERLAHLITTG